MGRCFCSIRVVQKNGRQRPFFLCGESVTKEGFKVCGQAFCNTSKELADRRSRTLIPKRQTSMIKRCCHCPKSIGNYFRNLKSKDKNGRQRPLFLQRNLDKRRLTNRCGERDRHCWRICLKTTARVAEAFPICRHKGSTSSCA